MSERENTKHRAGQDAPARRSGGFEIDRRSLLAFGGSAAALSLMGFMGVGQARPATQRDFHYVITDRRHKESLEFGQAIVSNGASRLELTDGFTRMWQETLLPLWRAGAGAVVGLTSPEAWHCLAEQARSEARRSTLIGRHVFDSQTGEVSHRITAPREALSAAAMIEQRERTWPLAMAKLLSHCSSGARVCDGEWRSSSAFSQTTASRALVSWIIS